MDFQGYCLSISKWSALKTYTMSNFKQEEMIHIMYLRVCVFVCVHVCVKDRETHREKKLQSKILI